MSVSDIACFLRSSRLPVFCLTLLGLVAGIALSLSVSPVYTSRALIASEPYIGNTPPDDKAGVEAAANMFANPSIALVFATTFLDTLTARRDTDPEAAKALLIFRERFADGSDDAQLRKELARYISTTFPLRVRVPSTPFSGFAFFLSPPAATGWNLVFQANTPGGGPAIVGATRVALAQTITSYSEDQREQLTRVADLTVQQAQERFAGALDTRLNAKLALEREQLKIRISYMRLQAELASIGQKQGIKAPDSDMQMNYFRGVQSEPLPQGSARTGFDAAMEAVAFLDFDRITRHIANLFERNAIDQSTMDSYIERLGTLRAQLDLVQLNFSIKAREFLAPEAALSSALDLSFQARDPERFVLRPVRAENDVNIDVIGSYNVPTGRPWTRVPLVTVLGLVGGLVVAFGVTLLRMAREQMRVQRT